MNTARVTVSRSHALQTPAAGPGRFAIVLLATLAISAALLRMADAIPSWIRGEPRGVREYVSLDALEVELETRVLLPSYFPDTLQWPPARVALAAGEGQPIAVEFVNRRGRTGLVVCQAIRGDFPIPARLLPAGQVIADEPVLVSDRPGRLTRSRGPDGQPWTDLSWVVEDRRVVMRVVGSDENLMRLARSLHRSRP
jgi:hypothetical protein